MEQERRSTGKRKEVWMPFLSGLTGAVVGGACVLFMYTGDIAPSIGQTESANTKNVTTAQENSKNNTVKTLPVSTSSSTKDASSMVEKALSSVVGVNNYQASSSLSGSGSNEQEAGSGSGVIYKKSGNKAYVVTNHHVVEGANKLEVKLNDGTTLSAKLLGSDQWLDLAVLEIDGSKVKSVANLGNSDAVKAGEQAIAIGNPLGYLEGSVTQGIISSKERDLPVDIDQDGQEDFTAQVIQTDASINPGNSGGPLLNANGEVIGINSSKIAQEEVEGIGFSIPINTAKQIIETLEKQGEIKRPQMGIVPQSLNQIPTASRQHDLNLPDTVQNGAVVLNVEAGSPAEKAGLQNYDVITELDGKEIDTAASLREYIFKQQAGDHITVTYYRDGQKASAELTLEDVSK
ncbi:trypsin-like peptidase domain-containing protein [Fictibacillus enclensis]|uniref:S1C family serine protease n=1 Tax=Fictibacillus enclensis TaxID=1017270 RepID=UPI0025A1F2BE|nr:trypsin-like peptidase domain-containing protein [Fictibacillus enclensis]MDM5339577.1 trypsin-like peptidase domain-containing protein [Fictibacillus enclensis]